MNKKEDPHPDQKNDEAVASHATLSNSLDALKLGEVRSYCCLSMIPLFTTLANDNAPNYITLPEALKRRLVTIKEIGLKNRIPFVEITNHANRDLIILAGQEIVGGSLNRVSNTTLVIGRKSRCRAPVCDSLRSLWNFSSTIFADSGFIMSHEIRRIKQTSVTSNLLRAKASTYHCSEIQNKVWMEITNLHLQIKKSSPTESMADACLIYTAKLQLYLAHFPVQPGQVGALFFINGKPVSQEIVSCPNAYERLHTAIVQSHALSVLSDPFPVGEEEYDFHAEAKKFQLQILNGMASHHQPPGSGTDLRLNNKNTQGAALCVDGRVVHALCFAAGVDSTLIFHGRT